jgi:hypothetical protein
MSRPKAFPAPVRIHHEPEVTAGLAERADFEVTKKFLVAVSREATIAAIEHAVRNGLKTQGEN